MTASIHAHGVIPRTGLRKYKFTIANADLLDNVQVTPAFVATSNQWFLVVSLPRELGKFIRVVPEKSHKGGAEARKYVGQFLRVPPSVLQAKEFVVVAMQGAADLDIDVEVDTDHPKVVEKAQQMKAAPKGGAAQLGAPVTLDIDVFAVDPETKAVLSSRVDARLILSPMKEMGHFAGYVALDFGNTGSTLVCSETNQSEFEVVQADEVGDVNVNEKPGPVQTALRIYGIKDPETPQQFTVYESRIGKRAMDDARVDTWLVLGAKRLLSDRRQSDANADSEVIVLNNTPHVIRKEDPAEVFISQMLRGFFYHRQSVPEPIVVTCPTTFSESEVNRLRTTVARAFHRVLGKTAASFRPEMIDARVPMVVDEASAAAFYFAYRDFIFGPGRMPAFRYLYPNGMHMLLYDCGGGTTDLALVRLESSDAGALKISVLGRAGHRTFGGDYITEQVFRLLKARLAELQEKVEPLPAPAKLAEFLDRPENKKAINDAVPTTFDVRQSQNSEAKRRRETVMDLWKLAERFKIRLSAPNAQFCTPGPEETGLLNRLWKQLNPGQDVMPDELVEKLKVQRREVDALIDAPIVRTIEYANDLLKNCLTPDAGRGGAAPGALEVPEVHWVYLVGNASRYPRIREMLLDPQRGLRVRFLKDRLALVRPEDFKNSVAKGAIVAMKLRYQEMGMTVSWDHQVVRRLPFDVVHVTLGSVGDRVLYHTGELYSELLPRTIDIKADPVTGRPSVREVVLSRRWPGETVADPYVIFRFPEPVEGAYLVEYDSEEAHAFIAYPKRDGGKEDRVIADPFEVPPYLAPPQSGKI